MIFGEIIFSEDIFADSSVGTDRGLVWDLACLIESPWSELIPISSSYTEQQPAISAWTEIVPDKIGSLRCKDGN